MSVQRSAHFLTLTVDRCCAEVSEGTYEGWERRMIGANNHRIRFDAGPSEAGGVRTVRLRDDELDWTVLRPTSLPD